MKRLVLPCSACTSNILLHGSAGFMTRPASEASIITNEKEWNLFRRMVVKYELSYKLKQHKRL